MTYMVAITGSRNFSLAKDFLVREAIADEYDKNHDILFLIGDCPTGADKFAWDYLKTIKLPYNRFEADWKRFGDAAGPIRNHEMIDYGADKVIAFPEDDSRGTRECVKYARSLHIPVEFPELPKWAQWAAPMATYS